MNGDKMKTGNWRIAFLKRKDSKMTDLGFLADFMIPVIVGICLCVGYVIKKWVKDVDNKYIPTVCALLGVLLAIWINGGSFRHPLF